MVALIVPSTVKSPETCADPVTERLPETKGSNIFICAYCYTHINT